MTVPIAIEQLFQLESEMGLGIALPTTPAVAIARLGSQTELIIYDTLEGLLDRAKQVSDGRSWMKGDGFFGPPLHALILPAADALHDIEIQMLTALYQFS
jgi:diphthamide biosynthesis methyltransferase